MVRVRIRVRVRVRVRGGGGGGIVEVEGVVVIRRSHTGGSAPAVLSAVGVSVFSVNPMIGNEAHGRVRPAAVAPRGAILSVL